MSKKERKCNYVVGYPREGSCVYGQTTTNARDWIEPVTVAHAIALQADMTDPGSRIFRLVDVTDELLGEVEK